MGWHAIEIYQTLILAQTQTQMPLYKVSNIQGNSKG